MGFASWQRYCPASGSGRQPNFAALNRGRHLWVMPAVFTDGYLTIRVCGAVLAFRMRVAVDVGLNIQGG